MAEIVPTHTVFPIPAYSKNRTLIKPSQYEARLPGAIVQVAFALIHHNIGNAKKSNFTAIVQDISVIKPPIPAPSNPFKRKAGQISKSNDATVKSPEKKQKA